MRLIDAHVHYSATTPATRELPVKLDVKCLNVCVAVKGWREKRQTLYRELARTYPERYAWCTTFDLPDFTADYAQRVIEGLERDFADGAIGCKIWKNVGMELKDSAGRYVQCDDPLFDPIYAHLAERGRTLLAHIAEPLACWRPLDPESPHYGYYRDYPEWHMAGRTDVPTHEQLMAARDRVLEKHPKLRVVGAHLGSLEYSLEEIAARLDRYPNFAVDSSARLGDIAMKPREKLLEFFDRYQDRLLWGTDVILASDANLPWTRECYAMEQAFFETDERVRVGAKEYQGLALPERILKKFYITNAQRWYPGL